MKNRQKQACSRQSDKSRLQIFKHSIRSYLLFRLFLSPYGIQTLHFLDNSYREKSLFVLV